MVNPCWDALSAGAPPALIARTVRLLAAGVLPEHADRAVARRMARDGRVTLTVVLDDLQRARPAAAPAAVHALAARLRQADARVLLAGQPGYPAALAGAWPEGGVPPWLLSRAPGDGRLPPGPAVAIVGTRRATVDGLGIARRLARFLADRGVTVVSGVARGIDQAAHAGALDAGGPTVGVLGTGFGVDYPAGDRAVRAAVAAAGGLVTAYPPGHGVRAHQFLARNRTVAGLVQAVVVVEGRARSGALNTAGHAAELGRDVYAVPGSLSQPTAQASLRLIRQGASVLTCFEDVLASLDLAAAAAPPPSPSGTAALPPAVSNSAEAEVLRRTGAVPADAAALAAAAGLPLPKVLSALAALATRGAVTVTPRGVVRNATADQEDPAAVRDCTVSGPAARRP